jgi:Tfp pilus assembly protein FimV
MDKIAAEKALAEANDRVAALEKNVRDMSSLLDMKNQTLAAMQNQTKSAAAPTEATSAPVETKESTATTTETQAAEKTEVKTEAEPASQSLMQMVEEKIKTDPLVTEMKTWKWDSAQFFNQDTAAYASAAAVVLLSLAFISSVVRRRRHPSSNVYDANPFLNERKTKAQSELSTKVDKAPTEVETKNSVFHSHFVPSVSQLDINEVDAVAEADALEELVAEAELDTDGVSEPDPDTDVDGDAEEEPLTLADTVLREERVPLGVPEEDRVCLEEPEVVLVTVLDGLTVVETDAVFETLGDVVPLTDPVDPRGIVTASPAI